MCTFWRVWTEVYSCITTTAIKVIKIAIPAKSSLYYFLIVWVICLFLVVRTFRMRSTLKKILNVQSSIFINYICASVCSCVRLFANSWIVGIQAPLSMQFSRQEYWSGLPFPSPGDLPDPEIKPASPACLLHCSRFFMLIHQRSPPYWLGVLRHTADFWNSPICLTVTSYPLNNNLSYPLSHSPVTTPLVTFVC